MNNNIQKDVVKLKDNSYVLVSTVNLNGMFAVAALSSFTGQAGSRL